VANAISWFEIPASNFERAVKFYNAIFAIDMARDVMMGTPMAFFPSAAGEVGGAVTGGSDAAPGDRGPLVFLNAGADLEAVLARIPAAGGRVLVSKTPIAPDVGCFAVFVDTEGNKAALFSR
jgi:predicted enzyme related to lactoylglutathione lyase